MSGGATVHPAWSAGVPPAKIAAKMTALLGKGRGAERLRGGSPFGFYATGAALFRRNSTRQPVPWQTAQSLWADTPST